MYLMMIPNFNKIPTWYSNVDTTYGNPEANNLPI